MPSVSERVISSALRFHSLRCDSVRLRHTCANAVSRCRAVAWKGVRGCTGLAFARMYCPKRLRA